MSTLLFHLFSAHSNESVWNGRSSLAKRRRRLGAVGSVRSALFLPIERLIPRAGQRIHGLQHKRMIKARKNVGRTNRLQKTDHHPVVGGVRKAQRVNVSQNRIEFRKAAGEELGAGGRSSAQFGRVDGCSICKKHSIKKKKKRGAYRSSPATEERLL